MASTEPRGAASGARSTAQRLFFALGLTGSVLALALLVLELLGLVLPALSADALDPERRLLEQARVEPHSYLAYANKPGFAGDNRDEEGKGHQISHNLLGFRNTVGPEAPELTWQKPEGAFRIVCLGGSSTYGHGPSSDATTWPGRLQTLLNATSGSTVVEVINGGCQGYSSFESLINLSIRMVDLEPDLVLVYHAINDMRCALWGRPRRDNAHWRAQWPVERRSSLDELLGRSTTYRLLRQLDPSWRARRSGDLGWYAIVDYRPGDHYARVPETRVALAATARNLREIAAVARASGARPVFVQQAMQWSDLERFGTGELQAEAMREVKDVVAEVARVISVPLIDGATPLEEEGLRRSEAGEPAIFTSEVHITDAGADLLARTIAAELEALGLVP